MPMTTIDSKVSFNETTFGFTPHSGSSFYLSRLPGEVGTFLSLTGLPLIGSDAAEYQISEDVLHTIKDFDEDLAELMRAVEMPIPSGELLNDRG
jgi:enoyl-CoA hydratase/carnithine racemase